MLTVSTKYRECQVTGVEERPYGLSISFREICWTSLGITHAQRFTLEKQGYILVDEYLIRLL